MTTSSWPTKLVPVLIPNDTVEPLRRLVKERCNASVAAENVYLFPNTGESLDHVTGWNCINLEAKGMGDQLKKPNLLIADKFRHRASTLFALQDLPRQQRVIWYRHLGHSASINQNVYQCPLAVSEITQVEGFLRQLETHGKNCNH